MNEYTSRKTAIKTPQNRKLPNFHEKVTDFLQETYRPSEIPLFYLSIYLPIARLESLTIHKASAK